MTLKCKWPDAGSGNGEPGECQLGNEPETCTECNESRKLEWACKQIEKLHKLVAVKEPVADVDTLKQEWVNIANAIGKLHGPDDPAALAFWFCIEDLHRLNK